MNFGMDMLHITAEYGDDEDDEDVVRVKTDNETLVDIHHEGLSRWWNFHTDNRTEPSIIGIDLHLEKYEML